MIQPGPERPRRGRRRLADQALLLNPHLDFEAQTLHSDPWRVLRILSEFVEGFDALASVGPAVSIFGSARVRPGSALYRAARQTAAAIGRQGYAIITGGGPGIMEAANQGAKDAGVLSVGCNIELPQEQGLNRYVDLGIEFRYFFARKTMFVKYAFGFVIFPGGFGTLDELFEALTLVQTGKIERFPIVLFGSAYWAGLFQWLRSEALAASMIREEDLELMTVVDDPEEAARQVADGIHRIREKLKHDHGGAPAHVPE